MPNLITITIEGVSFDAELNDSETAGKLYESLPMDIQMSRWGDEYYGSCGVSSHETENAREVMEVGELAYWAPGSAFCIFFGPTPASTDGKPRAASAVVPLGRILGVTDALKPMSGSVTAALRAV